MLIFALQLQVGRQGGKIDEAKPQNENWNVKLSRSSFGPGDDLRCDPWQDCHRLWPEFTVVWRVADFSVLGK